VPREAKAWVGPALGLLGVAAFSSWPVVAVAVTFLGALAALALTMSFNVSVARWAYSFAVLLHVGVVFAGSGSALLAAAVLVALMPLVPNEPLVRRLGYKAAWVLLLFPSAGLILFALAQPPGRWRWAAVPGLAGSAAFALFAVSGSAALRRQRRRDWAFEIGQPVQDFALKSRQGEAFQLAAERGRHVLVCFLQGDWCPICHVQMRIYQKEAPVLARHNVKLVAISPSAGEGARVFARDMGVGVDYLLLEDPENQVARQFGAAGAKAQSGKGSPLPVSFLIGPDGRLLHASRPGDVESFLDPRKVLEFLEQRAVA
jgi:peroxiredoxin